MKITLFLILQTLYLISFNTVQAQNSKLKYEAIPAWVTLNATDYSNTELDGDAEDGYLDLVYEKQVSLLEQAKFYKKSIKILSEAGVQNSSEISVNFDPAYQQLIIHDVKIIREGKSFNKLTQVKFKTIQQEKELDRHMYDGSLTALLVLEDVRKGDIIESSYTIKGFNSIFNGKYSDIFACGYRVPIGNLYYKLIATANNDITVKNSQTKITPLITRVKDQVIYEWRAKNVSAVHPESNIPAWYDPYPSVMISEFKTWKEVSHWAAGLYPRNVRLSPDLHKMISRIRENPNNEARILAALRFAQDDIRYMAFEMGVNAHKPSHPDNIFSKRLGDCKDKSYLLITMLNAMGIEANPVFINTTAKKTIVNWLPSGSAFDHCTVQVKADDKIYWLDPTISYQRGSLSSISYPDYQVGLVINESTDSLTAIPRHDPGLSDVKEIFDIPDMSGLARLKVVTKNTGAFADDSRYYFNNNSLYEMKNKYKDFYALYFDKIKADSLIYEDDKVTGTFTTTEFYTIKDVWKKEDGKKKIFFSPYVINSVMNSPSDKSRSMPFYLTYPASYKEQIQFHMPEDWPAKKVHSIVECAGFKMTSDGGSVGNKVTFNYTYKNLKDHITPAEAAVYFENYDEAYNNQGYELYYNTANAYSSNSSVSANSDGLFPRLYALLGIAVVITFIIKKHKQQRS